MPSECSPFFFLLAVLSQSLFLTRNNPTLNNTKLTVGFPLYRYRFRNPQDCHRRCSKPRCRCCAYTLITSPAIYPSRLPCPSIPASSSLLHRRWDRWPPPIIPITDFFCLVQVTNEVSNRATPYVCTSCLTPLLVARGQTTLHHLYQTHIY